MSGGSYEYAYGHVENVAESIAERHSRSAVHLAFADHLRLVAKAMHDVEWVDSCDYAPGADLEAIRAVISPESEVTAARVLAKVAHSQLTNALERAGEVKR